MKSRDSFLCRGFFVVISGKWVQLRLQLIGSRLNAAGVALDKHHMRRDSYRHCEMPELAQYLCSILNWHP